MALSTRFFDLSEDGRFGGVPMVPINTLSEARMAACSNMRDWARAVPGIAVLVCAMSMRRSDANLSWRPPARTRWIPDRASWPPKSCGRPTRLSMRLWAAIAATICLRPFSVPSVAASSRPVHVSGVRSLPRRRDSRACSTAVPNSRKRPGLGNKANPLLRPSSSPPNVPHPSA